MATARAQQAYAYYISIGYTPVQAAGIVGNLMQESGPSLSVDVVGDNGTAFGVAQWRGDRLTALRSFAASRGTDWRDFDTQLAFVDHELKTTERRAGDLLRSATTVPDATAAMISYERPQGWTTSNPRGGHGWTNRLSYAAQLSGTDPMAYTAPAATPAAQGAINAATGPAAGLPSPAPAPGSQRLFRPISEARTAREAGGTPRLDELSSIIQQRRAGMNPLLDRLQNFFQTRQAARQQNQTAPTPPAPIPSAGGGGGGGSRSDPAVAQLQQELAAAGFDPGPIDGLMGPRTRAAMAARDAAAARPAPTTGAMPRPRPQQVAAMDPMAAPAPPPNPMRGPPPLPPQNPARMGQPAAPNPQANLDYSIPIRPQGSAPISGPRPGSLTTGSLTPMTPPGPAATANLNFGIPIQPRNPATAPTPSANPTLGPMLAGYQTPGNGVAAPTTPVSRGVLPDAAPFSPYATAPTLRPPQGVLPPMQPPPPWGTEPMPPATLQRAAWSPGSSVFDPARVVASMPQASLSAPGWGSGMPSPSPMPSPTTLVGNTGTPFTREDAVNRGFMPAGRDDFGLQNGFFRDLPGFNDQNPNIMAPQALGGQARPVTTTTPTMPNMPLRGMPIPPWWRMFMGAGV